MDSRRREFWLYINSRIKRISLVLSKENEENLPAGSVYTSTSKTIWTAAIMISLPSTTIFLRSLFLADWFSVCDKVTGLPLDSIFNFHDGLRLWDGIGVGNFSGNRLWIRHLYKHWLIRNFLSAKMNFIIGNIFDTVWSRVPSEPLLLPAK